MFGHSDDDAYSVGPDRAPHFMSRRTVSDHGRAEALQMSVRGPCRALPMSCEKNSRAEDPPVPTPQRLTVVELGRVLC
jgi:hypothetical protein